MARQPRDLSRSHWFHIVQRGADRQDIYLTDHHRDLFETFAADAFDRYQVEAHAYVWMTNHTHLLAHAPHDGLSEAMRHLGSRYALAFNQATGRDGPLFTSRFHSTSITSDAQLAQTARYIHRNPLAFVPPAALAAYRWSSLGPICGRRPAPTWLSTGVVAANTSPEAYLSSVLTPQPADRFPFGTLPPLTPTTLDEVIVAVARVTGTAVEDLSVVNPHGSELRTLAITLAIDMRVADARQIAQRFGLSDPRSARRAARHGRARAAQSASFADLRHRVLLHLTSPSRDVADAA